MIKSSADGKIEDTGPLTIKRMETVDEEVTAGALDFMERAKKADKPFFLWWNSTRMHVWTHLKKESEGKTGLGVYAETAARYIVDLVIATRQPEQYDQQLADWIDVGASPRGTIALDAAARAHAWLRGQDYVSPEDVQSVAPACLSHRVHLSYEAEAEGKSREEIIDAILERVAVG